MSSIPSFLEYFLSRTIWKKSAQAVYAWLQSNSNTVIVDELLIAIRKRRDWTKQDEN